MTALLDMRAVRKTYRRGAVVAVDRLDLRVGVGEWVGLVGASGAGKSTVARLVAGLVAPDHGSIVFDGVDLLAGSRAERNRARQRLHLVFQDPYASLAPHLRVRDLVAEPLAIHGVERGAHPGLVARSLEEVGLDPARYLTRRPRQLSGGERQRVALARGLVLRPRLIVADEPTAMLDPRARSGLVELMAGLGERHGIAYLFITHDLALAHRLCTRLVVMERGSVVEEGQAHEIVARPRHPATASLVAAAHRFQASFAQGAPS